MQSCARIVRQLEFVRERVGNVYDVILLDPGAEPELVFHLRLRESFLDDGVHHRGNLTEPMREIDNLIHKRAHRIPIAWVFELCSLLDLLPRSLVELGSGHRLVARYYLI